MIRILSVSFAERSLLKGFTGVVTDLAFAHIDSSLLGCVDEAGNLMVWQLTCNGDKIVYPEVVNDAAHGHTPAKLPSNSGNNWLQNLSSPTFLLTLSPHRDQVVIHIRRPEETQLSSYRRIIWCPFIQDDSEDSQDATSQTLALLHEDMV